MTELLRRSVSPSARTRALDAAARTRPNPSWMRVRPARSTAVRLDPSLPRMVAISVTVAEGPTAVLIR
jgi:hypothetical protein